jgi:hypothetical protein
MNVLKSITLFSLFLLNACGNGGDQNVKNSPSVVQPTISAPTAAPTRSEASFDYLNTDSDSNNAFSTNAFLPDNPLKATNIFEGNLTITGTPIFKQNYGSSSDLPKGYRQWPSFSYAFVQDGERLIPVDRGHGFIGTAAWSITAGVGAVWDEADDKGFTRAAFPYTLKENNQNCEANGLKILAAKYHG